MTERPASALTAGATPAIRRRPPRTSGPPASSALDGRGAALCMATHGRGGFGRVALGSIADEVVGDARSPIVLVGSEARSRGLAGHRMILCWEGIELEPHLQATATEWALALDLDVLVLHVRRPNVDDYGTVPFPEWTAARTQVTRHLAASGVRAETAIVDGHEVAAEIVRCAEQAPTALIAMGCRRHGHERLGPLDNVVLRTVRHAPCPILVQAPPT
jgi:nucleotide-binding universal stress UspA family protein